MKKRFFLLLVLLLIPLAVAFPESAAKKKLTVMIYMCGSNLESGYGSASADIMEIREAGISRDVTVLIMIGGSESWATGYDPEQCSILEVSDRGIRRRMSSEKMNMGDGETLTALLAYGQENFPAEEYALILWDHGGGPNEGVCWDELFSMDRLSLQELSGAIGAAGMEKKLKWIGFDVCLMGTLEVAGALSPYAEYMIASQETEPDFGWNYAFLNGIENDATGADTGRRIVEAYFEGRDDYRDVMTLSCLDLSVAADVSGAMDAFFSAPSLAISGDTFAFLSHARGGVTGFGKAVRAVGEDGYDLADARGLVASLSPGNPEAGRLAGLLDRMVVCSRSNEEGANGVSLYHPFANKKKYRDAWREEYARLGFSAGYTDYIRGFGDLLVSGEMTDWSGIDARTAGFGADRENLFSLQLTEEQKESFVSAQILILYDLVDRNTLRNNCAILYTGKAEMDENGLLSASYSGKSLYIEEEDGTLHGPVDFDVTEDGELAYRWMIYLPDATVGRDGLASVIYYLETEDESEYPRIVRTRVLDEATGTYTNRIRFSEDPYYVLFVTETGRAMPEADEQGLLPMYQSWEESGLLIGGTELTLPNRWRFRWMDTQLTGDRLYAMFQITDVQQNTFCSQPISVPNPNREEYTGIPETDTGSLSADMSAAVVDAEGERGIRLILDMEDRSDPSAKYYPSDITINGDRICDGMTQYIEESSLVFYIDGTELYGIDRIETAELTVTVRKNSGREEIPVSFRFDGLDVSALWRDVAVLGETTQDDVTVTLLRLQSEYTGQIEATVLIRNGRAQQLKLKENVKTGKIELDGSNRVEVPVGKSRIHRFTLYDSLFVIGHDLDPANDDSYFYTVYVSEHLLRHRGVTQIAELDFLAENYEESFRVQLAEPWTVQDGKEWPVYLNTSVAFRNPAEDPDAPADSVTLAENNQYSVSLEKIVTGWSGVVLSLELENRSAAPVKICAADPAFDGETAVVDFMNSEGRGCWTVAPEAVQVISLVIRREDGNSAQAPPERISIGFESVEQREQGKKGAVCEIVLRLPDDLGTGSPAWIGPDRISAGNVRMEDVTLPEPPGRKAVLTTDRMLEDEVIIAENIRVRPRWISAGLTAEQAEKVRVGMMFLVRDVEPGVSAEFLSYQMIQRDENGDIGVMCPGVYLGPEGRPDLSVTSRYEWLDPEYTQLQITTILGITAYDAAYKSQTAKNIVIRADLAENSAAVTDMTLEGEKLDIIKVCFLLYGKYYPDLSQEPVPIFTEWERLYEVIPSPDRYVKVNGNPVRLAIRPVTEADDVYVVFAFADQDGTQYSLPPIPYPLHAL